MGKTILWMMICAVLMTGVAESGLYVLQTEEVSALVDGRGRSILEEESIDQIYAVREGSLYAAGQAGAYRLYNSEGTQLSSDVFSMLQDQGDCLIFRQDDFYGAMTDSGEMVIAPEWSQLVSAGNGHFLALQGDITDNQPDEILYIGGDGTKEATGYTALGGLKAFSEGLMVYADASGRYGCLDTQGREAIPCSADWMEGFYGDLCAASLNGCYGVLNRAGEWVIEPEYRWLQRGDGFIAALKESGGLYIFNAEGQLTSDIDAHATQASIVGDYVALWDLESVRLYDHTGHCQIQRPADTVLFAGSQGQVIASCGRWGQLSQSLINRDGSALPKNYQRIVTLCDDRYAWLEMQGVEYYSDILKRVQISWDYDSARYGLMDGRGEILLNAQYNEIRALGEDRLLLIAPKEIAFADIGGNKIRAWSRGG